MKRSLGGVLLFVVLAACVRPAWADGAAGAEARLLKDLIYLTSDECEGRGISTKGIDLAAEYVARQFQQAGLKPGGRDGTYFQPFPLTTGGKLGPNNRLVLRGPQGQTVALDAEKQFVTSLYGSAGKVEAPVVFAGHGITSTAPAYDDYAGLDVAGKVVVILTGTPRSGARYGDAFAEAAENRVSPHRGTRSKLENAEKHKAAGVILVGDQTQVRRFGETLPRPSFSLRDGEPSRLPVAHLRRDWLDRMLVSAGTSLADVEQEADATLKPRGRALAGWTCRLETEVTHNKITARNVVGVLDGEGPLAKETLVIGAHYDHVGMGSGNRLGGGGGGRTSSPGGVGGVGFPLSELGGTAVHHGADDNASGTVALIEIARRLGASPKREGRRVVFLAFTAEESGLIGSAYYCKNPLFPLEDTAVMLNMDMVGRLQDNRLMVGGVGSAKGFEARIDKLNEKHRFELVKEPSGQGPSDHSSFYARKVPVYKFFTGFHEQYHRPTDRVETVNVPGVARVAGLVGDLAAELRADPARPEYVKTGSFDRTKTLWSSAPSTGILPDYADTKGGVLLAGVINNTAAAKAGLKKGDRVTSLAGQPVKDAAELLLLTRRLKAGEKVEVVIEREGKEQKVEVQLARAPAGFRDPRLGFVPDTTDFKNGLLVLEVPEDGPAAKAGLKKGDRVTAIAGEPVQDQASYVELTRGLRAGDKVVLTVQRDGKTIEVQVEAAAGRGPRPAGGGALGVVPDFRNEKGGVLVSEVREGSPAAEAGVRAGDRITAVNGQAVKDLAAFGQALRELREGDKVELTLERDGKAQKVQAVLK
jgi:S1-C subfamily serine protease